MLEKLKSFRLKSQYLLLGIFLLLIFQEATKKINPVYEYEIVAPDDSNFTESMNIYGAQGWQATSCRRATTTSYPRDTVSYECIMIRRK